jgi:hypothetical protein
MTGAAFSDLPDVGGFERPPGNSVKTRSVGFGAGGSPWRHPKCPGAAILADRHAVVSIAIEEIKDLELQDFSTQNVIAGPEIRKRDDGYSVVIHPSYGIGGRINAGRVEVSHEPVSEAVALDPGQP